ncbi:MAG: acetylornithine transaminase [Rhizobiales bacterium 32-66-8]|nr:MAG: acetylornithine transaminase [Rhizobiales bacterium 32-66-8]
MITPVLPTYARIDLEFERGEGCWLVTTDGRRYLDFTAGIAVNVLGHAHPYLVKALSAQAEKLWHTSNLFRIAGGERLAQRMTAATFADTMFFTNSGAEALECAIKMARRYHYVNGAPERTRLITFEGAFHGRTLATIAAGGNAKYLEGFGPDMPGFDQVPFADFAAVKAAVTPETAGILLEPIQGEGGVRVPPADFLRQVRALCDEHGLLLVLDEVQSGVGRTGRLFAHELSGVTPDIMAVAKGIGGGFPMGGCLATEAAAKGMTLGTHGSTYGGNPLAMAVGNAVLDLVLEDSFLAHVRTMGVLFKQRLAELKDTYPRVIAEVRGEGLLLGLRAQGPAAELVTALRAQGLLVPGAGDNVVRLLPPLIVTDAEISIACDKIAAACRHIEDGLNMAPVQGAAE